jgi:hypothetical protein
VELVISLVQLIVVVVVVEQQQLELTNGIAPTGGNGGAGATSSI